MKFILNARNILTFMIITHCCDSVHSMCSENDSIFYHLYKTDEFGAYFVDDREGGCIFIINNDNTYIFVDMNLGESDAGKLITRNDTIYAESNDSIYFETMKNYSEYCSYFPCNKLQLKIKKYSNEIIRIEDIKEIRDLIEVEDHFDLLTENSPMKNARQKERKRFYTYVSDSSSVYSTNFGIVRIYEDIPNQVFVCSREHVTIYKRIEKFNVSDCQIIFENQKIGVAARKKLGRKNRIKVQFNVGHNFTNECPPLKIRAK